MVCSRYSREVPFAELAGGCATVTLRRSYPSNPSPISYKNDVDNHFSSVQVSIPSYKERKMKAVFATLSLAVLAAAAPQSISQCNTGMK